MRASRRLFVTLALTLAPLAATSCTYDFDAFEPRAAQVGDAAHDGTVADTSGSDATCTAPQTCLDQAKTCAAKCNSDATSCLSACGGNQGCKSKCNNTQSGCKSTCTNDCTTCTTSQGCPSFSACAIAAN